MAHEFPLFGAYSSGISELSWTMAEVLKTLSTPSFHKPLKSGQSLTHRDIHPGTR